MTERDEFRGRVAIVTGAGQGIGRAVALKFGQAGSQVVVADLRKPTADRVADEICAAGGRAVSVAADVSQAAQVREMVDAALVAFGRIDILVNNAGIFHAVPFVKMTEAEWDQMLDVHLKGTFLCSRAVVEPMLAQRSGCIVNVGSTSGLTGGTSGAHYAAAKGGIIALTRAMGLELAPYGIRVNAVAPSKIETEMLQGVDTPEARQRLIAKIPVGRIGTPEDIAEVVCFLASSAARYIVGEIIVATGGYR